MRYTNPRLYFTVLFTVERGRRLACLRCQSVSFLADIRRQPDKREKGVKTMKLLKMLLDLY